MKADLHIHTSASDGLLAPAKAAEHMRALGVELLAVTDHDTVAGLDEAASACRDLGVRFVPGIEISAHSNSEIHVLGYNIDYKNPVFREEIAKVKEMRRTRNIEVGAKLSALGVELGIDFAADGLGRMNIARLMVEKGYAKAFSLVSGVISGLPDLFLFLVTTVLASFMLCSQYPAICQWLGRQLPTAWKNRWEAVVTSLRTTLLAYVLDMGGVDGRTPWEDLAHLREELELYMPGLSKRATIIVANKMDLPGAAENLELLRAELAHELFEIIPVSAGNGELGNLKEAIRQAVEARRKSPFDF